MKLKRTKIYSVKDCSDLLGMSEQLTRKYIDDFKIGSREKGPNGVERRILNEKEFDKLSEIVELKNKGFTPKTIGLILSEDLTVVSRDRLSKIEKQIETSFENYGKEYLEMKNKLEELEQKSQKMLEEKEKESGKDEKIKELTELVNKLDKKVTEIQDEKKSKKPFWGLFSK